MDENVSSISTGGTYAVEEIGNADSVYRQVHFSQTNKELKRRFPNESHFVPNPELSVYWVEKISLKDVYLTIGLSYKPNSEIFKNPSDFLVYKFEVNFLRGINEVEKVAHTPVINGNPAPIGAPNIPSHASIYFSEDDPGVRVILSDYCRQREDSFCPFKFKSIANELEELKQKLDNTRFHRF